jgi:aryl-alcohol dehydrogenase-like predicted oxidoreductase
MPILGFGATTLGREISEEASLELLDHAYELGFRVFDTAESYGGGNARALRQRQYGLDDIREASDVMHSSELILGKWLQSRSVTQDVLVHTKTLGPYSRGAIHEALHRSLERLRLNAVDGFYLHSAPTNIEEAISSLDGERQAGRAGRIGICNAPVDVLKRAHTVTPLDLCQDVYNLALPQAENTTIPWCKENGVVFIAYSPLAAGFLTGKYGAGGELSPKGTRFDIVPAHRDVYFRPECFDALRRLTALSAACGVPQHLLALNWVFRNSNISIVLIGATRPEHLDNAVAAAKLSVEEFA